MNTIHLAINDLPKEAQAEVNRLLLAIATRYRLRVLSVAEGRRHVYDLLPPVVTEHPRVVAFPRRPNHEPQPPAAA